ncbi:transcriptional regulator [Longibacter salinarum]|uniref:Transcriptional regulator n=2 Tax=Longibacter salinarum TaxID=1850348 RepID=A0A2A8D3E5_9BACT|nr:transcriptional regulator [Longibacter salinarum]
MEDRPTSASPEDAEDDVTDTESGDRPRPERYTIGEVAERVDLEAHVLRYWESEFEHLSPGKDAAGRRIYTEADVDIVQRIQHLLKEEMYTIAGARAVLDREGVHGRKAFRDQLQDLRDFLVRLQQQL